MNGVAVLVAAAVLGVDYGWQPTTDGQLEYIVQIEPVTLVALRGGQELISQIDPYVQGVRRFRVRVGTDMVPRRGTPPRQPAPPLSLPVPAGVQYGWRGIDSRQMEFIIQLSHERLVLMRGGEELVGEMPVELQNVTQLRIRSGVEPPPRQGLQVASATLPPENPPANELAQPTPAPAGAPEPPWPQPPVQPPTEAGPAIGPPPRMGTETPGPNDLRPPAWQPGEAPAPPASTTGPGQPTLADSQGSPPAGSAERYSPAAAQPNAEPNWGAPPAAAPPNAGTNWGTAGAGALPAQPATPAADPRFEFAAPQGSATTQPPAAAPNPASREPAAALGAPSVPDPRSTAGDRPLNGAEAGRWPAASYDPPTAPDRSMATAPAGGSWTTGPVPVGSGPTNGSVYGGAPQPPAGGQQATPPTVQIPYSPPWTSGEQSGWTVTQDPAPSSGYPIASSRPFDMTAEVPRMPWERRLFDTDGDIRITEQSKDFWASLAATAQDPTLSFLHTGSQTAAGDRPWGPLALALMVLFVSLGGNLYMGWIAMDMYQRYLELADDLAEHDSPSRPSLDDDDPLDDEDDWSEVRRRRSRASVAA